MKSTIDELYEQASTLQNILDCAHKHPIFLIEVLEKKLQDPSFFYVHASYFIS